MNNILSFWLAPVTALFHPRVFHDAAKRSAWKGVLYVFYLSVIAGVLTAVLMLGRMLPVANEFVSWAQETMPVVIWTPEGISLENGQTTALLSHPRYGPVVAFDMTKTSASEADMDKAPLFVTSTKVFVKRAPGQIEERDITKAGIQTEKQLPPKVRITGEVVGGLFRVIKSTMLVIVPPVMIALFFFFIMIADLLYSLVGLLFNIMRKQKLRYGAILSLTCFATTVSFTLTWFQIMTPLRKLPLPFGVMILVNLVYMFIAFKITDVEDAKM
ncbi:MAG: DUF1189 family protein [Candidatus Omnitrophota bacterium]